MSAVFDEAIPVLREMVVDDLAQVLSVEQRGYSHPWTEGILRDCLRVGYSCWVCELGDTIVGHAVMSMALGEAHLLNICIDPDNQGRGMGRRLLLRMLRVARDRQADTVFLEVRASNRAAIALYEDIGFAEIGQRRGYYPARSGREDALVYAMAML